MGLIYIVALHQIEAKKIYENLSTLEPHLGPFEFEFLRPMQLADKLDTGIDLVVFSNPHVLNLAMKQQMGSWRKKGFLAPILLISRVGSDQDLNELEKLHNFVLLEKPYVDKDLVGIASKMLKTAQVAQRKFRRFAANQTVNLTSYKSEFKSETKIHNISLGGVCVEGNCAELKVGDLLHMNFNMDRLNSERTMSGRVVWVRAGEKASAGVEFVKDKEVYGQILKTIG
jgi:response regulator RpfG family c-di-GMP phosphodiesterase